jgi:microcystin-dependent protein
MDSPFLGQIQTFGFNFAPRGWALCQGQTLAISQNTALFSLLGTFYGGNGQTTFQLPNLGGRTMIGQGQAPGLSAYTIGEVGGAEQITLISSQMPSHTHTATVTPHTHTSTATSTLYAEGLPGDKANPTNRLLGGLANLYKDPDPTQNLALNAQSIVTTVAIDPATVTVTNGAAGGSTPIDIRSPYLCVNVSIALQGIFPSRN